MIWVHTCVWCDPFPAQTGEGGGKEAPAQPEGQCRAAPQGWTSLEPWQGAQPQPHMVKGVSFPALLSFLLFCGEESSEFFSQNEKKWNFRFTQ